MSKRKESDTLDQGLYMKKRRISDTPDIVKSIEPATLYQSQATQTPIYGSIESRKRKRTDTKAYPLKTKYLRLSSFDQTKSRVTDWAGSLPEEFEEMSDGSNKRKRRNTGSAESSIDAPPTEAPTSTGSKTASFSSVINSLSRAGIQWQERDGLEEEYQLQCKELLTGSHIPGACLIYPQESLSAIISETEMEAEAYVQRDILPWTVPSVKNLSRTGEWMNDSIKEQMHSLWNRIGIMGSTQPMPDYVAGHAHTSLSLEESEEFDRFNTEATSLRINDGLLLPFLICEAKSGDQGLRKAAVQNTHAGGIVVKAVFKLFEVAYGEKSTELLGLEEKILVWTIDMNHQSVYIWGHYGKLGSGLTIYRHRIAQIHLHNPQERFIPYKFVRNIYQDFAKEHLARIKDALKQIAIKHTAGASFGASGLSITELGNNRSEKRSESLAGSTTDKQNSVAMAKRLEALEKETATLKAENKKLKERFETG